MSACVCATHRDLEAMIAAGSFREDLYYRLRGIVIRAPALDERREDIAMLAAHFLGEASKKRRLKFSHEALAWLAARSWPGNVRELKATVDCAAALADPNGATISVEERLPSLDPAACLAKRHSRRSMKPFRPRPRNWSVA